MVMTSKPSTGTAPPAPGPGGDGPTAGQVAARRWRASRGILIAVLAMVLIALGLAALRPSDSAQAMDPTSPGPDGTRALAEILRQRGTLFEVSRHAQEAAGRTGPNTVLVVTRPERLTDAGIERLKRARGDLLLVEPTPQVLTELVPGVEPGSSSYDSIAAPECGLQEARLAGRVDFGPSDTYQMRVNATGCYQAEDGLYRLIQVPVDSRTITVLGSGDPLTNDMIDDEGNAALGMNLAGARAEVVWLIPDPPTPGDGSERESLGDLLPFGVRLLILQLLVVVVLVALWRGRRFGPVVAEALPVIVRSAETVEGRSRLYRTHRARGTAAEALRSGTRERLVPLLGLPRSAAQDQAAAREIVAAVAHRTTYDEAMVGTALYGPEPQDDGQLVGLTDLLDDLERQVRDS